MRKFICLALLLVGFQTAHAQNIITDMSTSWLTSQSRIATLEASQSDWTQSSSASREFIKNKPSLATVATSGDYNDLSNKPAILSPTQSSASRSLNTAFQISSTKPSLATYSVQCTITASIAGGQNCDIIFEIASDINFTSNVQTVSIAGTGQTYTLAVAIQGVQPQTAVVSGWVPSAYYARLRPVQNTGAPTFSYRAGQEVLF